MSDYTLKFKLIDPDDGVAYIHEVDVFDEPKRLRLKFDFNAQLKDELKASLNAQWGMLDKADPQKYWDVRKCPRTTFRLLAMQWQGKDKAGNSISGTPDPYERYRRPLETLDLSDRPYYAHQKPAIQFTWTKKSSQLGYDMGTGKTLIIGRTMEEAQKRHGWDDEEFLYVVKNGAMYQVMLDFKEWGIKVQPTFMSFETMKEVVANWPSGKPAPRFVVYDESTQIKSPTAQRSKQALYLADAMRTEHGFENVFVVNMTGTPAPKDPSDWWHQVEVVCPGFIREGSKEHFKRRMSVSEKKSNEDGGAYMKLIGWLDDDKKCRTCTLVAGHPIHYSESQLDGTGHPFVQGKNEVKAVYDRLKPIVDIKFKKDCMDLPERVKRIIRCKPTQQVLNAAKLVAKKASGAAQALTLLRELSDGFQYVEEAVDRKQCPLCAGSGSMKYKFDPEHPDEPWDPMRCPKPEEGVKDCDQCNGAGEVDVTKRATSRIPCPKDEVLEELLDEHEEIERLVVYSGFTGSVDRIADICLKAGWNVIRVDGRGWHWLGPDPCPKVVEHEGVKYEGGQALYAHFRFGKGKVVFDAQASTAAHGLNFDCCPTIVYFSNDFNFENRIQGDERNMRGKIKETLKKHNLKHVTIVDIVHLESDMFVLQNHDKKRKLQNLTMGDLSEVLGAG